MKTTREIIKKAFSEFRPAIAYSGGGDSTVLLDIVASMGYKPPLIFVDTQMEYADCLPFVRTVAKRYGLQLHIGMATITPQECWQRYGYPMLGKQSARLWMQKHKSAGFKIDCSTCCKKMKLDPGRRVLKQINCNATMTGVRGSADSMIRGLRAKKDGAIHYVKADNIVQVNPLEGWTDMMIRRYTEQHAIPVDPKKTAGLITAGCMFCGGGAQFDNSALRALRFAAPEEWRRLIVDYRVGEIILAIKYDEPLQVVQDAIGQIGGLQEVARKYPHVFDFLRKRPLVGYSR